MVHGYPTPGYVSTSIANVGLNAKIIKQGESSSYVKTREDIQKMKLEQKQVKSLVSAIKKTDKPLVPNRLASLQQQKHGLQK
mmetsp:Transcript_39098/g.59630  ORF Transcript_39098/g.59630 Transcript_39098/m.59630 type:complete len:82 (+) Transcript_39098:2516-2761(+)